MSNVATETAVRERPILFSGAVIRAILDGRKSQTRRVVKPQPRLVPILDGPTTSDYDTWPDEDSCLTWDDLISNTDYYVKCGWCPYGRPGDHLWVRETWHLWGPPERQILEYCADCADPENYLWRPSIHMPHWASRITLEIVGVRVMRLQDITEEDAKSEGVGQEFRTCVMHPSGIKDYHIPLSYRAGFANLWNEINERRGYSWESNPWVWCIAFKRI